MFAYDLLCPVCGAVMDSIHASQVGGMGESLIGSDGRQIHREESPECTKDEKWIRGWDHGEITEIPNEEEKHKICKGANMSERTTEERIKDAINEIVTLPENAGRDTELKSLNLDSLDVTELVMEVEDEFDGVTVEDDVVEKWGTVGGTVGDIIDYVEGKLA